LRMASASNKGKPTDLYKVLGVPRGAGEAQIKSAYRKLAIQYHPDKTAGDEELGEKFKTISAAYTVLSDPQKRKHYDQLGEAGMDIEAIDMEQMTFGTTLVAALFSKLGAAIPTAIPQRTLDTAKDATCRSTAERIEWGPVVQGKTSTHGAQFYCGELTAEHAANGYRVHCNSAAGSKFKLLVFGEGGELIAHEDSQQEQYGAGTSVTLHFCSFKARHVDHPNHTFRLAVDDEETPPVFRRLETLSASKYSPVRPGKVMFAVQGDNFFMDVKYSIQFSLCDASLGTEIEAAEDKLEGKHQELCKLEQEYWDAKQRYEAVLEKVAAETEQVDDALLGREALYSKMAGDEARLAAVKGAQAKTAEARAKAKAKKEKQAERGR